RGWALHQLGLYDSAIVDYNKAIQLDSEFAYAYNNRGHYLIQLGLYDSANLDFNKAIQLDPKYAMAYNNRSYIFYTRGLYDSAILDYNVAIQLDPEFAMAYTNRGYAYFNNGDYSAAYKDKLRAIELDSTDIYAQVSLGEVLGRMGKEEKALAQFSWIIRRWPERPNGYWARGEYYHYTKQWDLAISDLEKVFELNPNGYSNSETLLQEAREKLAEQQSY
ncbi:MAG TPA: hypothetical protein DCE41_04865, partial [Cytophagales bacterium]|nr:hypothetical protein [Cytophagales bacterium]